MVAALQPVGGSKAPLEAGRRAHRRNSDSTRMGPGSGIGEGPFGVDFCTIWRVNGSAHRAHMRAHIKHAHAQQARTCACTGMRARVA
eukprot:18407-Chlamydomonas_euryale.AAC.1